MAILSTIFKGVDELSDMFDRIAERGDRAVNQWDAAGSSASAAFEQAVVGAGEAADAAESAASSVDYWTDAIGNYDKSALEAIYSTEELVEMGYKTQEALDAEAKAAEEVARQLEEDAQAAEDAADEQETMGKTGSEAVKKIEDALTAAALAATIKEVAEAVYAITDAFSEAESIVVKATGATGDQLESLNQSMLKVYATVDDGDMQSTAGAIGEINTRLGLQGEELEHVTGLFMSYADNTNSSVVPAVQQVTKVMKNWGVEVDGTEGLLDKFTYAAQASGAGVDYLSDMVVSNKAMLQQMGYSLDESIALMAMFEYEGLNASSIMMGFRTAITNFSSEGKDASVAMQEVISEIKTMGSESDATAAAIDAFGSRAGAELAYAIRNGKFEIDEWVAAIEGAEGTLAKTDDAADTMADKWTMASNSLNTAFTSVIAPGVSAASEALARFVQGIGDFLNEHPALTKAITAIGVGLVALAGFIIVTKVAALASVPSFAAMGAAIWAATGPVGLIVAGVAALATGIAFLVGWIGEQNKEFNSLTATSKQHYEQLEELNAEYEEAAALYGENSEQAQRLAADIAGLEAVYEASKMTLEEFVAQNDALIESHDALIESYHSSMSGMDAEEKSAQALMQKLEQLSGKTNRTAGEQQQMEAIVNKLNSQFPELALSIDKTTGALEQSVDAYRALAEAEAAEQRISAQYDSYVDLLTDRADLEEQLAKAATERAAAEERYNNASGWDQFWNVGKVKSDLEDLTAEEERLQAALDETNGLLTEHEEAFESAAAAAAESAAYDDWAANVQSAASSVESAISNLSTVWTEVYDSAYSSISGQLGLYNELKEDVEATVTDLMNIWGSHTDYLNNYSANIASASEVFSSDLVNSLSDGSEESAAYLDSMVSKYDELVAAYGADSVEVQAYLDEVNSAFEERQAAMEEWSSTVADTSNEVATALADAQAAIDEFAQSLEISDEAAQYGGEAAQQYIESFSAYLEDIQTAFSDAGGKVSELDESLAANGYGSDIGAQYAAGISGQLGAVTAAAKSLSSAVSNALSGSNVSVSASVTGYASGTLSAAPGVALVGEEGPELINFRGGEVVYTADETSRILGGGSSLEVEPPAGFEMSGGETDKKITLEIAGSGALEIDGKADEDTILNVLVANVKPVLLSIIRKEVFEEGDLAYEF